MVKLSTRSLGRLVELRAMEYCILHGLIYNDMNTKNQNRGFDLLIEDKIKVDVKALYKSKPKRLSFTQNGFPQCDYYMVFELNESYIVNSIQFVKASSKGDRVISEEEFLNLFKYNI